MSTKILSQVVSTDEIRGHELRRDWPRVSVFGLESWPVLMQAYISIDMSRSVSMTATTNWSQYLLTKKSQQLYLFIDP